MKINKFYIFSYPYIDGKTLLDGLKEAVKNTGKDDVLLVCGSLYLCSDLYKYFRKDN